jgi:hypothetical protein
VTEAKFEVAGIVGRGNPNSTRSDIDVDCVIGNDWDTPIAKRMRRKFAMEVLFIRVGR